MILSTEDGKELRFLIDTGSNKNYIKPQHAKLPNYLKQAFTVDSAFGAGEITSYVSGRIFAPFGNNTLIRFYVLPTLKSFDGILGDDTLRDLKSVIDRKNNTITIYPNVLIKLQMRKSIEVNEINVRNQHLPNNYKQKLNNLIHTFAN